MILEYHLILLANGFLSLNQFLRPKQFVPEAVGRPDMGPHFQVFENTEMLEKPSRLERAGDPTAAYLRRQEVPDRFSHEKYVATIRSVETGNEIKNGRFPRSIWAYDR